MIYTGVGSRKAPIEILDLMHVIGYRLARLGWQLRSGGAEGCDTAFERGAAAARGAARIYRPEDVSIYPKGRQALQLAAALHPAWDMLKPYSKKLHGRNAFQVLGEKLNEPSVFLVCWTPDGCKCHASRSRVTGGTGTAISIASTHKIPVFNLCCPADVKSFLTSKKLKLEI